MLSAAALGFEDGKARVSRENVIDRDHEIAFLASGSGLDHDHVFGRFGPFWPFRAVPRAGTAQKTSPDPQKPVSGTFKLDETKSARKIPKPGPEAQTVEGESAPEVPGHFWENVFFFIFV